MKRNVLLLLLLLAGILYVQRGCAGTDLRVTRQDVFIQDFVGPGGVVTNFQSSQLYRSRNGRIVLRRSGETGSAVECYTLFIMPATFVQTCLNVY